MIKVSNLSKKLNGQVILDNISIEIKDGEILAILGASGAGKSVLLQHLIGLFKPDRGTIEIDRKEITSLSENALLGVRKKIGYLFQEGALYDFMNVFENIAFPLEEHTSLSEKEIKAKVHEVLELVGLVGSESKMPSELSGGMKKRAALARAIILNSKILFCDEPTSGLDPLRSRDISDLIHDIARRFNCTMVITSHDVRNSFRIADRLALMYEGKIVAIGTKEEMSKSPEPLVRDFFN